SLDSKPLPCNVIEVPGRPCGVPLTSGAVICKCPFFNASACAGGDVTNNASKQVHSPRDQSSGISRFRYILYMIDMVKLSLITQQMLLRINVRTRQVVTACRILCRRR